MDEGPGDTWARVAEVIARARDLKGWTNKTLSDRAEVSDRTIGHLLKGDRSNYTPETLTSVARALGLGGDVLGEVAAGRRVDVDEVVAEADLGRRVAKMEGQLARIEERVAEVEAHHGEIMEQVQEVLSHVGRRGSRSSPD